MFCPGEHLFVGLVSGLPLPGPSVCAANATLPNDIVSANMSAAINNEMRLRIRFLSSIIPVYKSLAFLGYRSDCCVP